MAMMLRWGMFAASAAGAQLVVIRRPPEQGETASEVLKRCKEMIR